MNQREWERRTKAQAARQRSEARRRFGRRHTPEAKPKPPVVDWTTAKPLIVTFDESYIMPFHTGVLSPAPPPPSPSAKPAYVTMTVPGSFGFTGSALLAETPATALAKLFPALTGHTVECPAPVHQWTDMPCPCPGTAISNIIQHLNDYHRWTREQIADWLDTLDVDLTLTPASTGD